MKVFLVYIFTLSLHIYHHLNDDPPPPQIANLRALPYLPLLIFQENAKEVRPVFQNLLNFSNQNHTFLIALI
jgi:hypothetical protein